MTDSDTYTFQVTITRSLSDDLDVIGDVPGEKERDTAKRLVEQLVKELQSAWDNDGTAGLFNVESITANGATHKGADLFAGEPHTTSNADLPDVIECAGCGWHTADPHNPVLWPSDCSNCDGQDLRLMPARGRS